MMDVLIGVISDTHGLLRPELLDRLRGVNLIIHAGDVGDATILDRLRELAPVHAVRGNVDRGLWADGLPETDAVAVGEAIIYVLHDIGQLDLDPKQAGFQAVVYGHSHVPSMEWRGDVLYLNPGSVGPRRFSLPVSLAFLRVSGSGLEPELIELSV